MRKDYCNELYKCRLRNSEFNEDYLRRLNRSHLILVRGCLQVLIYQFFDVLQLDCLFNFLIFLMDCDVVIRLPLKSLQNLCIFQDLIIIIFISKTSIVSFQHYLCFW